MNSIGTLLRLTTFGESHGKAMGGILDGIPAGICLDFDKINKEIARRRPGQSSVTTSRAEDDAVEFLSGISEKGFTLGTPIGFIVRNKDHRSSDYNENRFKFRPNHADYTYIQKYGLRDHRGGGRSSARETVSWVIGAAITRQWLEKEGISVSAILSGVGDIALPDPFASLKENPESPAILLDDQEIQQKMVDKIAEAKKAGDSVGGSVACLITGLRPGVGEPMFDKLQSRLAGAMLSLNAVKSFEYGLGAESARKTGSESADIFHRSNGISFKTNYSGGIQGGISNGLPVYFSVAFKPTPTLLKDLETVDINGNPTILKAKGRHDPCVALRGVPVVEALAVLVIGDMLRLRKSNVCFRDFTDDEFSSTDDLSISYRL